MKNNFKEGLLTGFNLGRKPSGREITEIKSSWGQYITRLNAGGVKPTNLIVGDNIVSWQHLLPLPNFDLTKEQDIIISLVPEWSLGSGYEYPTYQGAINSFFTTSSLNYSVHWGNWDSPNMGFDYRTIVYSYRFYGRTYYNVNTRRVLTNPYYLEFKVRYIPNVTDFTMPFNVHIDSYYYAPTVNPEEAGSYSSSVGLSAWLYYQMVTLE